MYIHTIHTVSIYTNYYYIHTVGYASRNISGMLSCWGDSLISQKWGKYADNSGICPFHWTHHACGKYKWKGKKAIDITGDGVMDGFDAKEQGAGCVYDVHGDILECICVWGIYRY